MYKFNMKKRYCQGLTAEKQTKMCQARTNLHQNETNVILLLEKTWLFDTSLRPTGTKLVSARYNFVTGLSQNWDQPDTNLTAADTNLIPGHVKQQERDTKLHRFDTFLYFPSTKTHLLDVILFPTDTNLCRFDVILCLALLISEDFDTILFLIDASLYFSDTILWSRGHKFVFCWCKFVKSRHNFVSF